MIPLALPPPAIGVPAAPGVVGARPGSGSSRAVRVTTWSRLYVSTTTEDTRMAHGTEGAYTRGCRCDECRAASAYARRLRRAGLGPGKIPKGLQVHGITGYLKHRCRCEVCRAANAAIQRRWYHRNKERHASAV